MIESYFIFVIGHVNRLRMCATPQLTSSFYRAVKLCPSRCRSPRYSSSQKDATDRTNSTPGIWKTGVQISALGLGGHHLGDAEDQKTAEQIVARAIDGGVTFLDNCWEYHRGKSEIWMGAALKGKRQQGLPDDESLHAWARQRSGAANA